MNKRGHKKESSYPGALYRVRSNYSEPPGGSTVDELLKRAVSLGWTSVVLADSNLCGAHAFGMAAARAGCKPIYGLEVVDGHHRLVLIARNARGYSNLCQIASERNLSPSVPLMQTLERYQNGLFALCCDAHSLTAVATVFDHRFLFAEILRPGDRVTERALLRVAESNHVRPIAGWDVRYAERAHAPRARLSAAIRTNRSLSDMPFDSGRHDVPMPAQYVTAFADMPEAIRTGSFVAGCCHVDPWSGGAVFPRVGGDAVKRLHDSAAIGLAERYGSSTVAAGARLQDELDLVCDMGFADYFLVVAEIVEFARSQGSPVACRGSAAGSLLAYCLGIANVDPIRYSLSFDRFLNRGREDFPDIDVDLCHDVRDGVIDHVFRRYGAEHVAMIATHVTMKPRLALRLTGKAFGLSEREIGRLQRNDYHGDASGVSPRERAVASMARDIVGFPHHVSLHPGGIVITPDRISTHVPLRMAPKGVVMTEYDKGGVEAAGLVKIDLLGNRGLSAFGESVRVLAATSGTVLDAETIPEDDAATAALATAGRSIGVNQLESPAMRRLLIHTKTSNPADVMKALALVRPAAAAAGAKRAFVERVHGVEPLPDYDPRIRAVLDETMGTMIYEDDALKLLDVMAGMTADHADRFRKSLNRCTTRDQRRPLALEYFARCRENEISVNDALEVWTQLAKFNAYSFCRAHAASYGRLGWANLYVKAHWPQAFWVGALNNNQSMYPHWVYVEEMRRDGLAILPPSVNASTMTFSVDEGGVRVGLSRINGLSHCTIDRIVRHRPFAGFADFLGRVSPGSRELEALIRSGALDICDYNRPQMLALAERRARAVRGGCDGGLLFGVMDETIVAPRLDPFSEAVHRADEWRFLGFAVASHPLAEHREDECVTSASLTSSVDKHVTLRGLVAARRLITAEDGRPMCFLTLSDEDGLFEVTVNADDYERNRGILSKDPFAVIVEGTVREYFGAYGVAAKNVDVLSHKPMEKAG